MTLGTVHSNGIDIAYEATGDGPPLVMIMGIGAPMVNWPEGFYGAVREQGFTAIRFDNRDVGRSSRLDHLGVPSPWPLMARRVLGRPVPAPYRLEDMADDVAGLLDGLHVGSAHVVGASMGGMIAQTFAIRHPSRTRSLTSIMSCTGSRLDSLGRPEALAAITRRGPTQGRAAVDHMVGVLRTIGSRSHPTPEDELRDVIERCIRRGMTPDGFARQWAAILATGSRWRALRRVDVPTLVIHGDEDPLMPPRGGRATAWAVPGARLARIEGMGHDLPRPLWPQIVGAIADHARAAG